MGSQARSDQLTLQTIVAGRTVGQRAEQGHTSSREQDKLEVTGIRQQE